MERGYIVANWKENKTENEAKDWLDKFLSVVLSDDKEIIICPPDILLSFLKKYITDHQLNLRIGAQNVSEFMDGPNTGEVSARELREYASYVIVGHSERRRNFGETSDAVLRKAKNAIAEGMRPIICVSNEGELSILESLQRTSSLVAYEPLEAIGTGKPNSPDDASKFARLVKNFGDFEILYGGSVTGENVHSFFETEYLDGVLVGSASLSPESFGKIIKNA